MSKIKCKTPYCRNEADRGLICSRCYSRAWRAANPVRSAFLILAQNARRREIPFDLTLEEFTSFCIKTEYIRGKGKTSTSYSIDRRNDDPAKGFHGYRLDNIRIMTLGDNTRKKRLRANYCEIERQLFAKVVTDPDAKIDGPF